MKIKNKQNKMPRRIGQRVKKNRLINKEEIPHKMIAFNLRPRAIKRITRTTLIFSINNLYFINFTFKIQL